VFRVILRVVTVTVVAALALANDAGAQTHPASAKRNVLLIIADDLRTELGCYGVDRVRSPNIDRLAGRAVRFERAYCQYPVCNPSRTSFLTGLRPDATQVFGNTQPFRKTLPDVVTLPQHLRRNGYFTASLGKVFHRGGTMEEIKAEMDDPASWDAARYFAATSVGNTGEGRDLTGGRLKWCRWLSANGDDEDQPDGQIAREAIRLLDEHRDRPFFLAVGFHKPHDPFIAPKKYFDLYPLEKIVLPTAPAEQTPAPPLAIAGGELGRAFDQFTDQDEREFTRAYLAGVSFTDAQVGRVLDALESRDLTQNTIVIFLGDHGYHLGERNWWNKNTLFEFSARAPLLVAMPGSKGAGKPCRRPVEFVDLYPTVLDLCGLSAPPQKLAGSTLRPLLDDPNAKWDKPALTQVRRGEVMGRSVRTERWRYTEWDQGRRGRELYDHESDPTEQHNLADDVSKQPIIAELKVLLPQ
jgi:uncharacterized sulfatase